MFLLNNPHWIKYDDVNGNLVQVLDEPKHAICKILWEKQWCWCTCRWHSERDQAVQEAVVLSYIFPPKSTFVWLIFKPIFFQTLPFSFFEFLECCRFDNEFCSQEVIVLLAIGKFRLLLHDCQVHCYEQRCSLGR